MFVSHGATEDIKLCVGPSGSIDSVRSGISFGPAERLSAEMTTLEKDGAGLDHPKAPPFETSGQLLPSRWTGRTGNCRLYCSVGTAT
jgi:hypothetical protein